MKYSRNRFMLIPICEKHSIEKTKNNQGAHFCKMCYKENAKRRAKEKISSGVKPSLCKKCNNERIWDTWGNPKCLSCRGEYSKKWIKSNLEEVRSYRKKHYEEN